MLSLLFKNLWGYDIVIFLCGAISVTLFVYIMRALSQIGRDFVDTRYLQNEWLVEQVSPPTAERQPAALLKALNRFTKAKASLDQASGFYHVLTNIYPLLGILGTVTALLSLESLSSEVATIGFTSALTSTFWGIVFAALSKFGEGFFMTKLEQYDKLYHEVRAQLAARKAHSE